MTSTPAINTSRTGRTVETTATVYTTGVVAAEVTGFAYGASECGAYGTETILPTHDEALAVARRLRASGYRARVA